MHPRRSHPRRLPRSSLVPAIAALAAMPGLVCAEQAGGPLISQSINAAALTRLTGNISGWATPGRDMGLVPGTLKMDGLALVLRRSTAQQRALEQLLSAQQDVKSPLYHHWLTPEQFGSQFGAADADVRTLSTWLEAQGFAIQSLTRGRHLLHFSGTARQVAAAFHTPVHYFNVSGERHWANVADPELPGALVPAVAGIVGLHDFRPKPQHRSVPAAARSMTGNRPQFNTGPNGYGVGPVDFATIYNLQPLWNKGITGSGEIIAIAAQSNINVSTPASFWSAFGVAKGQTIRVVVPPGVTDPGEKGDDDELEADLDVEVAGGVAQGATLILVPASSATESAAYAIDNNLAPIVSISFGECEANLTAAGNAQVAAAYQEASALGITVLVAAGDQGSAGCDDSAPSPAPAQQGIAVNGLASTPYNTAVGGTDFNFFGVTESQYWSTANATGTNSDALSYMPEMAWNTSCANPTLLQWFPTYATVEAICNDSSFDSGSAVLVSAGGGGLSSVSARPSWQSGVVGIPAAAFRALPDISFFAAVGFSGNAWIMCGYANTTCDPKGSEGAADGYDLIGGTSASTPAFAGIMALLLQTQVSPASSDGRQGLINPTLYQLAGAEYGTALAPNSQSLSGCNSNNGSAVASSCIFYDITTGTNAPPCTTGSPNCLTQTTGDSYGILSENGTAAYTATAGFDLATGLGSLNGSNFVTALWIPPAPTGLAATPGNGSVALKWTASNRAQTYNVYQGTSAGAEAATPALTGVSGTAVTVSGLANGQGYYFKVIAVNGGGSSGASNEANAIVLPSTPTALTADAGNGTVTLKWVASKGAIGYSVYQGTGAGSEGATAVTASISGATATLSGLSNGHAYFFKVAAMNGGGASAMSNEASATPVAPPSGGGALDSTSLLALAALALIEWRRAGKARQSKLI
jgi:subtilase family serine protease